MADSDLLPNETVPPTEAQNKDQADVVQAIADTYTFVRSREINTTFASFTLDHYISEAKMQIKGDGRLLADASGQDSLAVGTRPTQLQALASIQQSFNSAFDKAKQMAQKADQKNQRTG